MEATIEKTPNSDEIVSKPDSKPWLFQKGDDPRRNIAGKPKGTKHFSTLFEEMMKEKIKLTGADGKPVEMTILRAMGLAMARKAMKGDVKAFEQVADRLDGKAIQAIEHTITEPPQPIMPIKNRIKPNAILPNNGDGQNIGLN